MEGINKDIGNKTWVVSVNMGYGHQRTAYPLRDFAYSEQVLNANDYDGIPKRDRAIWEDSRRFYEAISKFKRVPLAGNAAFSLYDKMFQRIFDFYPRRDMSRAGFLTRRTYGLIKNGWGRNFIAKLSGNPLPFVTTFFIPAFMAEEFDYPNEIYLIVCDADVSRQWVAKDPAHSRINYCVPNSRVYERLKLYGVPKRRLFLTGYPLPESNISHGRGRDFWKMEIIKGDLARRLINLDPCGAYAFKYRDLIKEILGELPESANRPLTIMFSAGGAGAQSEIGLDIMRQFGDKMKTGAMKLVLSAGTNGRLKDIFEKAAMVAGLGNSPCMEVLFEKNIGDYFCSFNKILRKTDVLWTKPSELSFYSALGIPIIIAPPIGSQEDFNKEWLMRSGFGIEQENPKCIAQWFFDWIDHGYLAEAAMEGFIEGERLGTYHIKRLVSNKGELN